MNNQLIRMQRLAGLITEGEERRLKEKIRPLTVTINGVEKEVAEYEMGDVNRGPENAFIQSIFWADGTEATEEELDSISSDDTYELLIAQGDGGSTFGGRSLGENQAENAVYTATYDNDFGTFIDDLAHVVGSDNNVEMGPVPITLTPNQFNAWDEFGYDKYWNHIPDGQPFKITGDTEGLAAHPSLKNYTFVKNGNVIKGDPNG